MKKLLLLFIVLGIFKLSHEHNGVGSFCYSAREKVELKANVPIVIDYNKYLGTRYKWGGTQISTGLDCSAFVQHVYDDNNIKISRTSRDQVKFGEEISFDELRAGDLLFFSKRNDLNTIGHVSIYIGNNRIMHAVSRGVVIDSIGDSKWVNYWDKRLLNIRRIPNEHELITQHV